MRSWTLLFVAISLVFASSVSAEEGAPPLAPTTQVDGAMSATPDSMDARSAPLAPAPAPPADPMAAAEVAGEPGMAIAPEGASAEPSAMPGEAAMGDELVDGLEPTADSAEMPAGLDESQQQTAASAPKIGQLGPMAVDESGQKGRIHTVLDGDTLWDISEAYLGTPWVWPSVWTDNDEIQNPHVILPGDRIWITAGEMRKVTNDEADRMIAAGQEVAQVEAPIELEELPAAIDEPLQDESELMAAEELPAAMDQLPVAVPLAKADPQETGRTIRVSMREAMGFVTKEVIEAATSIIDSPSPRTWLVDGDRVYLGLGEGEVEVDDEFTIFREAVGVVDVDGERLLGYHVDVLGWAVVREIDGESAIAEVRISSTEIRRGDRVIPRADVHLNVPVRSTPDGIEGRIVYTPNGRTNMADGDYVYINRGLLHGFEVGSEVEVYVPGRLRKEKVSQKEVKTPNRVVARMVLVDVKSDSAVAFVVHASRELEIGDHVRAAMRQVASR
jgi:hypothetical protein